MPFMFLKYGKGIAQRFIISEREGGGGRDGPAFSKGGIAGVAPHISKRVGPTHTPYTMQSMLHILYNCAIPPFCLLPASLRCRPSLYIQHK